MDKRILRTKAAAEYLGISAAKLRELVKAGKIAYIRDGTNTSAFRFLVTDLNDHLAQFRHVGREKLKKFVADNDIHPYVEGGQAADLNLK